MCTGYSTLCSEIEVGMSLNWIYQVAITAPWITAKHLVVSVSTKVLKKPPQAKRPPKLLPILYPCFYPNAGKGLCYTQKVFQLAECSEIKGGNLSADFSSDGPFLLITGRVRCFHREMWGQMSQEAGEFCGFPLYGTQCGFVRCAG